MNNIIERVAKNHNCTPEEVEKEIAFAISEARKCSASNSIKFWKNVKSDISMGDLIYIISQKVYEQLYFSN